MARADDELPETSDTDGPKCPRCGFVDVDTATDWGSADEADIECGSCGKPFTVRRSVTVDWTGYVRKDFVDV